MLLRIFAAVCAVVLTGCGNGNKADDIRPYVLGLLEGTELDKNDRELVEEALELHYRQGVTPLMLEASGHPGFNTSSEGVKALLDAGANANAKADLEYDECGDLVYSLLCGRDGVNALMVAADNRNPESAKLLLDAGADVNAETDDGTTALMMVALYGNPEFAKLLLDAGADVNAETDDGTTALMMAAQEARNRVGYVSLGKHGQIVRLLLDWGADVDAKNDDGKTALMLTNSESVKRLLRRGPNLY